MHGTTAKILRVDLTSGKTEIETLSDAFYRQYPGGKALAGYILLNEIPPHTDPLSPENVVVIAAGLLTGAPVSTATRYIVSARSPLTGAYGESEASGYWGPELKMAGFEAIVIRGRAAKPVYLWVKDGQAEIRPASHLWGKLTGEVQAEIRRELEDERIRVLQIGIAGENGVLFAGLTNDLRHFNGRNGMGAVFGAKNLRAVAVRGTQRYTEMAHDPAALMALGKKVAQGVKDSPQALDLQVRGTPGLVEALQVAGMLPTRNFRQGVFEGVDGVKWEAYEREILTGRSTCYACAIRCKRDVRVDGKNSEYGGPEYEAVNAFGPLCAVSDMNVIAKANELCNAYMLDVISTGVTIAFAMECFERGLIGLKETGGIELRFGNGDAMLKMIELIAHREGIGDLLADGSKRAAERIGGDAPQYAMQVKGQELAMHDPRGKYNVGMGYAVSEIGADHLVVAHDTVLVNPESISFKNVRGLGITEAQPLRSLNDGKMQHFYILERWNSLEKVVGFCFFGLAPRSLILPEEVLTAIRAATGWEIDMDEALMIGERATNMARLFNVREGFSRADDTLPKRLFEQLENGPLKDSPMPKEDFEKAQTVLYEMKGWDPLTAKPTPEKLKALGLDWALGMLG